MSKKLLRLAALMLAVVGISYSGSALAVDNVFATAHNMNGASAAGELCAYCHTPHGASATAPLWNRTAPGTALGSFTMYDSPTIEAGNKVTDPAGVSLGCLSCHDGVNAYNATINTTPAPTGNGPMTGGKVVGPDLSNDHPISVDITLDSAMDTPANVIAAGLKLYGAGVDQVECASCHNPHDNTNGVFLRSANTNSDLCTTCHVK